MVYIYDLPFEINSRLCKLLDVSENWKNLASLMKYNQTEIEGIEKQALSLSSSPTKQLLIKWGQLNHLGEELFVLLFKIRHVKAIECVLPALNEEFKVKWTQFKAKIEQPIKKTVEPVSGNATLTNLTPHNNTPLPNNNNTNTSPKRHSEIFRSVATIPEIKYDELKEATNNWSNDNLLGRGGFAGVYKGEWKLLTVAVKRLKGNDHDHRELISEMCVNQYRHDNILLLYGYSLGGPEACIVYQLMCGGSLDHRLRLKSHHPPLTWSQRLTIAHGVARGLWFLHDSMHGTPLIHGDIKPANILLDQSAIPKIADFGLARKGQYGIRNDENAESKTHFMVSKIHGTRPYLPKDYLQSRLLSTAVDVYSYGVVLLEIASGLRAQWVDGLKTIRLLTDYVHELHLYNQDLSQLEDEKLKNDPSTSNPGLCLSFVHMGLNCTHSQSNQRPDMMQVCKTLESMINYHSQGVTTN